MISPESPAAPPLPRRAFYAIRTNNLEFLGARREKYFGLPTAPLDGIDSQVRHLVEAVTDPETGLQIAIFSPFIEQARLEMLIEFDAYWNFTEPTHFIIYEVPNITALRRTGIGILVTPNFGPGEPDISMRQLGHALQERNSHEQHAASSVAA